MYPNITSEYERMRIKMQCKTRFAPESKTINKSGKLTPECERWKNQKYKKKK